ncbi:hypothetical protein VSS37_03910 [Candidatus Thiothrix sp. Deng01]|uniref:DUF2282 domain-containing protein n=1 Tax=Candidatus Thiothrix phosphatis TaxID=3112415 RepID=A0ABU6CUC6_9GAMM|nr:hypothetical protein [Candidatus Thiothrix sp. Deng01]MEB4590117.1 hypothetical protein [Candidatus Thiothrix sp. Deng01]
MKAATKQLITGIVALAAAVALVAIGAPKAMAADKLPTVQAFTPAAGVDAGCGKGKTVYTVDGKKFCAIPKSYLNPL